MVDVKEIKKDPSELVNRSCAGLPFHLRTRSCKPVLPETLSLYNKTFKMSIKKSQSIFNAFNDIFKVIRIHLGCGVFSFADFYTIQSFKTDRTNQVTFGIHRRIILRKIIVRQLNNIWDGMLRSRRRQGNDCYQTCSVGKCISNNNNRALFDNFRYRISRKVTNQYCAFFGMKLNACIFYLSCHGGFIHNFLGKIKFLY